MAALLGLGGAFAAGMFGWLTAEIGVYGIILNVADLPEDPAPEEDPPVDPPAEG